MARPLSPAEHKVLSALRRRPTGVVAEVVAEAWGDELAPRVLAAIRALVRRGRVVRRGRAWAPADP